LIILATEGFGQIAKRQLTKWPNNVQHSTTSYDVVENMNRRTAEQGTAEYRSKKHYLLLSNTSAVRNSLFDIRYFFKKKRRIPQGRSEITNHTEAGPKDQVLDVE